MGITITEIESAIEKLSPEELSEFFDWCENFEERIWDQKIADDLESGKLKNLINEAEKDFSDGKCQPL